MKAVLRSFFFHNLFKGTNFISPKFSRPNGRENALHEALYYSGRAAGENIGYLYLLYVKNIQKRNKIFV